MNRKIFVNLAVRDLEKTMTFFSQLGFEFNKQFTDDNAACMIINPDASVMLLAEPFFQTFTKRAIADASKATEGLYCLSADSRADVDALVNKAFSLGATPAMPAQDHGFMYGWSFYDLDGHHWEVAWMDPGFVQK